MDHHGHEDEHEADDPQSIERQEQIVAPEETSDWIPTAQPADGEGPLP